MADGILILLMLIFAISGYRQGFVIGALSFGGFFSGVLIGLQLGPLIANQFSGGVVRLVVSLVVIFALAVLGQTLAGWFGTRIRRTITSRPMQHVDDVGGAFMSVSRACCWWRGCSPSRSGRRRSPGSTGGPRQRDPRRHQRA